MYCISLLIVYKVNTNAIYMHIHLAFTAYLDRSLVNTSLILVMRIIYHLNSESDHLHSSLIMSKKYLTDAIKYVIYSN